MGGTLRKILTTGVGAALLTEESLRNALSDSRLTRQARDYLIRQALKGREEITKVLMGEFKRFLDHLDIHDEIEKALVGMKLEIQATVTLAPRGGQNRLTARKVKIRRVKA